MSENKKLYQIIFQDDYNNLMEVCWYENLNDSIEDLNGQISIYGNGKYSFKEGDLKESAGTFGWVADIELASFFNTDDEDEDLYDKNEDDSYDDFQGAMVRVFIHELNEEQFEKVKDVFLK